MTESSAFSHIAMNTFAQYAQNINMRLVLPTAGCFFCATDLSVQFSSI